MHKTTAISHPSPSRSKNLAAAPAPLDFLAWFPPVVQELYQCSGINRDLLDPVLSSLEEIHTHFQFELGPDTCPHCTDRGDGRQLTVYRTQTKLVLATGNIVVQVAVKNFRCPRCHYRPVERAELTLFNGIYDRRLVLAGAALQACGCSLFDTRGLLTSFFQVTPALSTILGCQ